MARKTIPFFIAVLCLAAMSAPPAGARSAVRTWTSHGYTYVARTALAEPGTQQPQTAPCPTGTHAFGGGLHISGDYAAAVSVASIEPTSTRDGWLSYAQNEGASWQKIVTYAICHKGLPHYVQASATVSHNGVAGALAICAPSESPYGGGVHITGSYGAHVDVNSTSPLRPDAWQAYANNRGTLDQTLTAFAVCSPKTKKFATSFDQVLAAGTQGVIVARCPRRSIVVGGGVYTDANTPDVAVSSTEPADTGDAGTAPDNAWRSWVRNSSASQVTMTAHAVCVAV